MEQTHTVIAQSEHSHHQHHHSICWPSTFAGSFIALMTFILLSSLGIGILGLAAQSAIENESGGSLLASGSGLWLGITAAMSLFVGSYFAVRIANKHSHKVGAAHGFVVASLFFILLLSGVGKAIGGLSHGFGSMVKGLGESSSDILSNPTVQDSINKSMPKTATKSEPKVVAQGLAIRLLKGDAESAKAYYSYETGLSGAEVDTKIAQLKNDFEAAAKNIGDKAAQTVAGIGWSFFVTFLVGLMAALIGGFIGANSNFKLPLASAHSVTPKKNLNTMILKNENGSAGPYILGWLLGVPTSILFLIFILRAIF